VTAVLVLVDADNLAAARLRLFVEALPEAGTDLEVVVAGSARAVGSVAWPSYAEVLAISGWQRADVALVEAYEERRDLDGPLVLVTGDGDFGLLATRHRGPVLVVSGSPSSRLREGGAAVVDPALVGAEPVRAWLRAVTDRAT
jgi:hypothetical protein